MMIPGTAIVPKIAGKGPKTEDEGPGTDAQTQIPRIAHGLAHQQNQMTFVVDAVVRGTTRRIAQQRWELDVVEMFPRLDRQKVLDALKAIHTLVGEARKVRGKNRQCCFALHQHDGKLDTMGKGSARHFTNVTFAEVLAYVEYELFSNDIFVAGTRVLRQRRGVAIGGTCSAQLACLYCMYQEHDWYKEGFASYADRIRAWMHPRSVPLFPFRFRDNIVGVAWGGVQLSAIHRYFSEVYGLELQMEGQGDALPSLEARLSLCSKTGTMGLRLKRRAEGPTDEYRSIIRYVDWYSTNAKTVLKSLVPALVGKCIYYAMSQTDVAVNVRGLMRELLRKGYPDAWWMPMLRYGLRRRGVGPTRQSGEG